MGFNCPIKRFPLSISLLRVTLWMESKSNRRIPLVVFLPPEIHFPTFENYSSLIILHAPSTFDNRRSMRLMVLIIFHLHCWSIRSNSTYALTTHFFLHPFLHPFLYGFHCLLSISSMVQVSSKGFILSLPLLKFPELNSSTNSHFTTSLHSFTLFLQLDSKTHEHSSESFSPPRIYRTLSATFYYRTYEFTNYM